MVKLKNIANPLKLESVREDSNEYRNEKFLVRRLSSSSNEQKNQTSDANKNDLIDTYRSVSEIPKRKKKPKIWEVFDWPFRNVSYERMSPNNKKLLCYYKSMSYSGILLLIIAYSFFILVLFSYLIHIDAGEYTDEQLFVPVSESLLHSIVTLWRQKAYFVVFVVFTFSLTIPFIKMIATLLAYIVTSIHRKRQIYLFFGYKVNKQLSGRGLSSERHSASPDSYDFGDSVPLDYSIYEEGRIVKYAREVLLILKLISKYQMVDVIILMLNICFLRSAFTWARPGKGLLYLAIYCISSIMGTQLLNLAVEGERDMFEYWRAVRLLCLPNLDALYKSYYNDSLDNHNFGDKYSHSSQQYSIQDKPSGIDLNENNSTQFYKTLEVDMHSGLNIQGKLSSLPRENPSVFDIMTKTSGFDVMSNCTSEADLERIVHTGKKDMTVRWYRCEIFVTILVTLNVICAGLILSNEKLFGIKFAADAKAIFGVDGTQMTFFEIVLSVRDCWEFLPLFVYFFLSILVPVVFHISFLVGLLLYRYAVSNKTFNSISNFDPSNPLLNPCQCLNFPVKLTKFVLNFCNLLSEWSIADVLALGTVAGYVSISTAANVLFYIPPKKVCCVFTIIGTFGITSLLLNLQFYMWYTRIINRLSDVTIYIESIHSASSTTNSSIDSSSNINLSLASNNMSMVIKQSSDVLHPQESQNENNDIMHDPNRSEKRKRKVFVRGLFKFIDFIRHIIYSKMITSIFFALLFVLALYLFVFSFVYKTTPTPVDQKKVQNFLDVGMPEIYKVIKRNIPRTFGDCNFRVKPPKPCVGTGSIYQLKENIYFDLVWLTGPSTISFLESNFKINDENRLEFSLHIKFNQLKPYMQIGSCISGRCNAVYSGDNLCCGDDVHVIMVVSVSCEKEFPHFRDIQFDQFRIKNLKFKNELHYLVEKILKIEEFLEKQIIRNINGAIKKQQHLFTWRGLPFSVIDFINFLAKINFPNGIVCPAGSQT